MRVFFSSSSAIPQVRCNKLGTFDRNIRKLGSKMSCTACISYFSSYSPSFYSMHQQLTSGGWFTSGPFEKVEDKMKMCAAAVRELQFRFGAGLTRSHIWIYIFICICKFPVLSYSFRCSNHYFINLCIYFIDKWRMRIRATFYRIIHQRIDEVNIEYCCIHTSRFPCMAARATGIDYKSTLSKWSDCIW